MRGISTVFTKGSTGHRKKQSEDNLNRRSSRNRSQLDGDKNLYEINGFMVRKLLKLRDQNLTSIYINHQVSSPPTQSAHGVVSMLKQCYCNVKMFYRR